MVNNHSAANAGARFYHVFVDDVVQTDGWNRFKQHGVTNVPITVAAANVGLSTELPGAPSSSAF